MPPGLESSRAVFDRATRLARALFGRIMAQVTLVTEDGYWRSRPQPIAIISRGAGVNEVIRRGEAIWVEDAREDRIFRGEPEVTVQGVQFFAGAPIRLDDGTTPGALWVAGLEPRRRDDQLLRDLQDLADFVADEWTRVRASQARAGYEEAVSAIVGAMPVAMVLLDQEFRLLYASPPWIEARGLQGEEIVGRNIFDLRPDLFERWRGGLAHCMTGQDYNIERVQLPRPDGGVQWARVQIGPWRDKDGAVAGLIITWYDITQHVEALESSERSEDRLKVALQLAELHVFEMDYARRELFRVGSAEAFFDPPRTYQDLEQDIWSTVDPRDRDWVLEMWRRHREGGEPYRPQYRVARTDGEEVWVAAATKLILDEENKPVRLVGALRNITREKAAERAMVQAKEDAEAANRAKSAFLATMSHEIRTPLNGVLGMAQALAADGDLTEAQRERIEVIRQSGESLLTILNDVLDLSKIEAGKLTLETAPFEVDALAKAVHATFQAIAEAKGLDFELSVDHAARGVYEGDQVRVRQILWNLVSNALKFTERGGVKVRIGREKGDLSLTVFDSGIGMSAEQLAGLFRKFEQADASTTRRFGGTGLGLAICRELAELMGGEIRATSAPGMGSTFTASLPLPKASRTSRGSVPASRAARGSGRRARTVRVLAAEDNPMNQFVLKTLLAQIGIDPVIVADGREAVAAWEREPWDVILMDVQMPVMDGPTATAQIRARERSEGRARTPIVALTANAMSHQIAEYLQSGMDALVAKPIEAQRLYEALQAAVDRDAAPGAAVA
ncbi:hypothetical protein DJ019_19430 [Phenylobacterium kunshanense]|uniref:Sensory/regulatory protein RpfC n=2 Tax=Phenylobacterium kunshanense TaxID=1445034 RepID=A0A328B6Q0_9CAUL|nr:hypothetical protein DJ019_19430 [Phenylobacterium kunshanense]